MLGLASAVAAQPTRPILVLGDSISAAYGLSLEQGWVALLESRLENEDRPYHTVNASISGDTSAGGLRRLPALLETHEPRIVIIELGGNDGLRGYPVGQLRDNLITMIELSEAAGAAALVLPMEIPRILASSTPMPFAPRLRRPPHKPAPHWLTFRWHRWHCSPNSCKPTAFTPPQRRSR